MKYNNSKNKNIDKKTDTVALTLRVPSKTRDILHDKANESGKSFNQWAIQKLLDDSEAILNFKDAKTIALLMRLADELKDPIEREKIKEVISKLW